MVGSQLVGLVPLKALLDVAAFYCEKENLFVLEEGQRLRLVGGAGGESGSRSGAPDACTRAWGPVCGARPPPSLFSCLCLEVEITLFSPGGHC